MLLKSWLCLLLGAFPGSRPQSPRHTRCFICGILLHLFPKINSYYKRFLLPPQFRNVSNSVLKACPRKEYWRVRVPVTMVLHKNQTLSLVLLQCLCPHNSYHWKHQKQTVSVMYWIARQSRIIATKLLCQLRYLSVRSINYIFSSWS